ncbi:hypothetical protein Y032_0041g492 [Ancylostoma ceylanicum]|nr:hypothetical protein Y032_0041g492 [Ancylostoma ceylanicum]
MEGPLFAAAPQAAAASFFGANSTSTAQAVGATNAAAVTAPRNPNTAPRHLFSSTNSSSTGPEVLGNCWTSEDTWHNVYSWINNSQRISLRTPNEMRQAAYIVQVLKILYSFVYNIMGESPFCAVRKEGETKPVLWLCPLLRERKGSAMREEAQSGD